MAQSDLLGPLVDAIETVKRRITEHGASLRENETRTRVALIDPILRALGWDVSDPGLVTLENPTEPGRVDYALLSGGEERPRALVEAKRLGTNLQAHRSQMVNYAVTQGIGYAGLTDGNVWEFYDVFKPTALSEKKLLDIVIADAPANETALKMLLLWQPNVASGTPVEARRTIVGELAKPDEPPIPESPPVSQHAPPGDEWVALSDFDPKSGSSLPSHILFPGNRQRELKHWRSFVDEVTQWLFDSKKLTSANVPFSYGKSGTGIVNSSPTMRNRKNMLSYYQVPSQEIFVDAHGNAPTVVGRARAILVAREVDSSTVYVKPR